MRSVFVENLTIYKDEVLSLKVKEYHHLINVIRIKINEKVVLFDRLSNIYLVETVQISKKSIEFEIVEKKKAAPRDLKLSIALGKLKKDALDISIKQLVEIGCQEITIFKSSFSQSYDLKKERLEKLVISAMEQSNNYLFPTIQERSLEEVLKTNKNIIYFSAVESKYQKIDTFPKESILIIGPEGGLSEREENLILNNCKNIIHLPTPILRAQTAVSFCMGYYLGKI
jgi:16S rRNA (uracil1498-N3)-methyltransferase